MRIISFGWTAEPFLAGEKSVTRRDWKESYAKSFKQNQLLAAYDKDARYAGKQIGVIQLVDLVKRDDPNNIPDDYEAEGFGWIDRNMHLANSYWHKLIDRHCIVDLREWWQYYCKEVAAEQIEPDWVVRFKILDYTDYGRELKNKLEQLLVLKKVARLSNESIL